MRFDDIKKPAELYHILANIPVDNPKIFKGVCLDIEKNKKESVAYDLFYNLVKLADTCKLEVSFNEYDYSSILVYAKGEPDREQIDSIPLMDMTIRGLLQVLDTTLDYLEYVEESKSKLHKLKMSRSPEDDLLFDLNFIAKGGVL